MKRNKTLRRMYPTERKIARLINELESVKRRLGNSLPAVHDLELEAKALQQMAKRWGDMQYENDRLRKALLGDLPFCTRCGSVDHERLACPLVESESNDAR